MTHKRWRYILYRISVPKIFIYSSLDYWMNILFALFAHVVAAGSISFPSSLNDAGIPTINCTFVDNEDSAYTMAMRLSFTINTFFQCPSFRARQAFCESLSGGYRLQLRDDPDVVYSLRTFDSTSDLALARQSWIRRTYESFAYTGNYFILNISLDEFVNSSCVDETSVRIPISPNGLSRYREDEFDGRMGTNDTSLPQFQARYTFWDSRTTRAVLSLPTEYVDRIVATLSNFGALGAPYMSDDNIQNWRMTNCYREWFIHLPYIHIWLMDGSLVILSPENYIDHDTENNICDFLVQSSDSFGRFYFNPFLIKGLNFRISENYLDICDSSNH